MPRTLAIVSPRLYDFVQVLLCCTIQCTSLCNTFIECIMDTIKKEGLYNGLLHILLLRMAAHVAKELGMPPGGEFRRAFEEVGTRRYRKKYLQ